MNTLLENSLLAANIHQMVVHAPRIGAKARPGQFVVVMAHEAGERVPLTIADFDGQAGTVTLVLTVVGAASFRLSRLRAGEEVYSVIGPLGMASELERHDSVVMVAGGVGTAPVYPIARAFHGLGCRVTTIQGARTKDLLFWCDRIAGVSDRHIITTDDGSFGRNGLVTGPLHEVLAEDHQKRIGRVVAIGPAVMMRACAKTTRPFGVKTVVSLNSVMVDGTGMCGGCRVEVDGQTQFTCVDGPEFDGHLVDWDLLMARQKTYVKEEQCALEQAIQEHASQEAAAGQSDAAAGPRPRPPNPDSGLPCPSPAS